MDKAGMAIAFAAGLGLLYLAVPRTVAGFITQSGYRTLQNIQMGGAIDEEALVALVESRRRAAGWVESGRLWSDLAVAEFMLADSGGASGDRERIRLGGMVLGYVSGGTLYWVHQNHIGQPMLVTAQNGDRKWWTRYKPFGDTRAGKTGGPVPIYLRYPGQYLDAETGLAYNGFRDYDAVIGRYIQSDPIGLRGGWNTYAYVGGNPVMRVDPEGVGVADR